MEGIVAIIVAIITTAGTLGAAYYGAKRIRSRDNPESEPDQTTIQLREAYDFKSAEASIWKSKYESAMETHAAERAALRADITSLERRLELTQHDADECSRQINNLYSELRAGGHLMDRRRRPRQTPESDT